MRDNNTQTHLSACKQMRSGSFKNVTYKLFAYKSYNIQGGMIKLSP